MRPLDIGQRGERRLTRLDRTAQALGEQMVGDGVEAVRGLRMALAHVVQATLGMAIDGGRHQGFDGSCISGKVAR